MRRRALLVRWLPALLWGCVVLGFSSETFAATQTSRFVMPFLRWAFPEASPHQLEIMHRVIRKGAHLIEYAVLAVLFLRAFSEEGHVRASHGGTPIERSRRAPWVGTLLVVMGIAATDEYRQSLLPMRTGSLGDWFLDLGGAALGLGVVLFWTRRGARARRPQDLPARGPHAIERSHGRPFAPRDERDSSTLSDGGV